MNGQIYFSVINDLLVRVTKVAENVAYIKHHGETLKKESVPFSDLETVGMEEVNAYLGR